MHNLDIPHLHQMEQFLVEVCLKQQVDLDMEKNFLSYHISRETWTEECGKYYYRADYDSDYLDPCETLSGGYPASCRNHPGCDGCMATSTRIHWHPSIHMPKEAARIWLKVTDVRVERLQGIEEDGVWDEGFRFKPPCLTRVSADGHTCELDGPCTSSIKYCDMTMGELFGKELWDSTIKKSDLGRYGWDANPFVWVIEFERCEKPEDNQN